MTIRIKQLHIVKDGKEDSIRGRDSHKSKVVKLQGDLSVALTFGNLIASSEVDISTISENLQEELYTVLTKIENELNGVNLKTGESINNGRPVNEKEEENETYWLTELLKVIIMKLGLDNEGVMDLSEMPMKTLKEEILEEVKLETSRTFADINTYLSKNITKKTGK